MQALIYESRAEAHLTDAELEVVLIGSRVRNALRGVTGVLLKHEARIVQYLEGEATPLDRTFAAIAASPLHRDVAVLERVDHVERVFDRWHMGFHGFHADHRRADTTGEWLDSLDALRPLAASNAALERLLTRWDGFSTR